jgi:hypothetical protein
MRKAGLFIFIVLAWACGKSGDERQAPVITTLVLSTVHAAPGDVLEIEAAATDNEALSQARLRIRSAFTKSFGAWRILRVNDISGRTWRTTYQFLIPDTVLAGLYTVDFQVADAAGNTSRDSTILLTLLQPGIAPEFIDLQTIPALTTAGVNSLTANDSIIVTGFATGTALQSVRMELKRANGSDIRTFNYPVGGDSFFDFGATADTIRISTLNADPVVLVLRATDAAGHQARLAFPLNIVR